MSFFLAEYLLYDVRFFDARQSLIKALGTERQESVIDPQSIQDGGIEVIDVDRVVLETGRPLTILIDDVVAVFVGPTMLDATLDPSAC